MAKDALRAGSGKLGNKKHESFAQNRAVSRTLADSYADAYGKRSTTGNNNMLRVSGKRLANRPEIQARISFLVSEARTRQEEEMAEIEIPENLGRSDILDIVLETTETLENCYQALLKTGLPEIRKRQFYSTLAAHLARQSKLVEGGAVLVEDTSESAAIIRRLNQDYGTCSCQN